MDMRALNLNALFLRGAYEVRCFPRALQGMEYRALRIPHFTLAAFAAERLPKFSREDVVFQSPSLLAGRETTFRDAK